MSSAQLLIAQGAVLVVLFGVMLMIIRSSARQLKTALPPMIPVSAPPVPLAQPVAPAMAAAPILTDVDLTQTLSDIDFNDPEGDPMGRSDRAHFDFDANLHPRLVVESGHGLTVGQELVLEGGLSIGRAEANDLSVNDDFMSHMHARILRRGPFFYVEDLGSTNGTFINEQRITETAQLRVRDEIRLGETILRYEE
jgi:hypothetical protein